MPKVTMFYCPIALQLTPKQIAAIAEKIKELVAKATSFEGAELKSKDVDFLPFPFPEGAKFASPLNLEIECIGWAERRDNLRDGKRLSEMKTEILGFPVFEGLDKKTPILWLKYVDTDGPHV
jgi:hypothetical protein